MRTNKKNDKVAVALVLCFCVLAIASIFTMRSGLNDVKPEQDKNINIAKEDKNDDLETKVVKRVPTVDSQDTQKDAAKNDNNGEESKGSTITYSAPVDGKMTLGYSATEPVYSATLEQYAIHEGIDYEAEAGTDVKAIADGTVTKVYTDDKLGLTIEILHPEGITSRYSNLNSTKKVGMGDVLKQGDVISGVGNSSLFESADPAHLHFEILLDGKAVDPTEYLNRK